MMGLEFSFIKRIIKGKFTFANFFFKKAIQIVLNNENLKELTEKWFKIE